MHDIMDDLYELCETLEKDLAKTNEKLRMAGGELSGSDLEYIQKLTHSMKSLKTIMAMLEADDGFSRAGGNRNGNMGGMSGARGRTGNVRRDSMGRFSRDGSYYGRRWRDGGMSYDGARDELMEHVEELMGIAKDEPTRKMIERFKQELKDA